MMKTRKLMFAKKQTSIQRTNKTNHYLKDINPENKEINDY